MNGLILLVNVQFYLVNGLLTLNKLHKNYNVCEACIILSFSC
jgi:hypothetical protein